MYKLVSITLIFLIAIKYSVEKECNYSIDNKDLCNKINNNEFNSNENNINVKSTTTTTTEKLNGIVKSSKWTSDIFKNLDDDLKLNSNSNESLNKISNKSELNTTLNINNVGAAVEKEFASNLIKNFLSVSKVFDASKSAKSSELCRKHSQKIANSLLNLELWALKMHDSSAKISSGILNGNINQFGDYDQCLESIEPNHEFSGQYCLAYLQPKLIAGSDKTRIIFKLAQSHEAFRSDFNDAGHRVPRFSLINWGLCVPSTCTPKDVEYSLQEYMKNFTKNTGLKFDIRVEPEMCNKNVVSSWDTGTKLAFTFFGIILTLCAFSTIYEMTGLRDECLTSFSLKKNVRWLFSTNIPKDDIEVVHGIRFFNAIMLLLAHKSMAVFFSPYVNRTYLTESLGQPWTVIGRAASLYTDPFLLFSGMLTSYSLIGKLQKGQRISLKNEYIGRLIRIVPSLVALVVFSTFVLPLWGSGPQWNLVVGHHSKLCKQHWWKNFLFIHNYFGFGDMCLTHTHHLGIDTELFAISPFVIWGLWKWPKKGLASLLAICVIGSIGRYYITIYNELSNYVYFGTSIQQLFKTADLMYSFPPYRSTVYIMGILLGYAIRKYNELKLTHFQLNFGYTVSFLCFLLTLVGPAPMGDINYKYNSTHAAIYAAFGPIAWCLFFAWIVFVSHIGYRNKFINLLSWKGFQVTTKLSYSIYLTQFPVFFYNVGRRRHAEYYYNFVSLMLDINEYASIFIASIVLTLLFDAPFQNLKKILFKPNVNQIIKKKEN